MKALNLVSPKSTAEIEALGKDEEHLDIQLPLTLKGWDIVALANENWGRPVVVTSADGDVFIGEISDVDEGKYILTVELS